MRGNVLDLAVGVIIGGAFNTIVTSLCNDVIMPGIAWLVVTVSGQDLTTDGKVDFSKAMQSLNVGPINLGNFAAAIINFLIMAIIIFMFVKGINKLMNPKKCPFCMSEIDINATRCAHCTSVLELAEEALKEETPTTAK